MAEHRGAAILLMTALVAAPSCAQARVQPYQIVRLVTFKTECRIETIEERAAPRGQLRFSARCENVSFYPDGVEIACTDADDDRSCTVPTKPKRFDQLELLKPRR